MEWRISSFTDKEIKLQIIISIQRKNNLLAKFVIVVVRQIIIIFFLLLNFNLNLHCN